MTARRRSHRSGERGAALFVVVLAVTLLTGVGLYTVHSASLSARAAGHGRQALQAAHVAELNGVALLSLVRTAPQPYLERALNPQAAFPCEMNQGLANASCFQLTSDMLVPPNAPLLAGDSLGPLGAVTGKARIELTDVNELKGQLPGYDSANQDLKIYQATATVIGSLNPSDAGAACVEDMMQVTGQHLLRTHLVIGPIPRIGNTLPP